MRTEQKNDILTSGAEKDLPKSEEDSSADCCARKD